MSATDYFLENGGVEGIRLLHTIRDKNVIHDVKVKLSISNHGPGLFFPGNHTIPFNMRYKLNLKKEPHFIAAKPLGKRYMLFTHPNGKMYLVNETGEIFVLDQDHTPREIPINTILDGIVVRKIVRDGVSKEEKPTFVIMDATCVNGVNLTKKSFEERNLIVKAQVVTISRPDYDAFGLDFAKYEDLSHCEEYLDEGFQDHYQYPLASLLFQPLVGTYHLGGKGKKTFEWDIHSSKEYLFRLKTSESESTGDLYAIGTKPKGVEIKFDTMKLTDDEMRTIADGSIIECSGECGSWKFIRVRDDVDQPNVHVVKDTREVTFPVTRNALLGIFKKETADEMRTIVDGSIIEGSGERTVNPIGNYLCPKCWSAICGETDRTVVASCGHSFHEKCLKNMSDNNGVVAFPVCLYLSNFPTVICNQEITSYLQPGKKRAYTFAVGKTFRDESRIGKKRTREED